MSRQYRSHIFSIALAVALAAGCTPKPVVTPPPGNRPEAPVNTLPPGPPASDTPVSPTRTEPVTIPPSVPAPTSTDPLDALSVDEVNKAAALKPVFFLYDSDQLDETGRQVLTENAQTLKTHPQWIITVEGHCDERGSAEYNLALGDRRAQAARNYLLSLGVSGDRLRTVSYGKEFPFDPGHDESAWLKNRRAQFMVTAK